MDAVLQGAKNMMVMQERELSRIVQAPEREYQNRKEWESRVVCQALRYRNACHAHARAVAEAKELT